MEPAKFGNPALRDLAHKVRLLTVLALQFGYREAHQFLRELRQYLQTLPL